MNCKRVICVIFLWLLLCVSAACSDDAGEGNEDALPQALKQAERQIKEQSFYVELDGWGKVMFAPFIPDREDKGGSRAQGNRDVRFKLMQNGETVYTFPARYEDDILQGQEFAGVAAVSFFDYNEDGRTDIMLLIEYTGGDFGMSTSFYEPRLYTQEEGETEFYVDVSPMEYLLDYRDSISVMKKGLEAYARKYAVATGRSAWEVERFAKRVRRQILAGDFEALAESMVFPIRIDHTIYIDKAAFMKAEFVTNPSAEFLEALKAETCENLFCNYRGVMMGDGSCWITEDSEGLQELKIYAVNGITPEKHKEDKDGNY